MSPAGMTPFLCPKEAGADHEVALIEEVGRIPDLRQVDEGVHWRVTVLWPPP